MSDARTDFFDSDTKGDAASRDDFFSGKYVPVVADKKTVPGKGYMDAEAIRRGGYNPLTDSPIAEIPSGFNQGVAHLVGLPVSTLVKASNLASAGMGYLQSKITGNPPSQVFDPVPESSVPFTGAWNEQLLNSSPMGDVTSVRNPNSTVARVVHETAAGVPGGIVGGGPGIISGAAGGAGSAIATELGADPATAATVSLLAGVAGAKVAERIPKPKPKPTAQELLNEKASGQSMGAAGAAVDLQKLSPDLRAAVEKAVQQTGGAVNPEVLARQIQADSLPVKVRLSEGQALGDERLISLEQNARGKHEGYSKGFAAQNKALVENMRVLRDESGPDVFSTNATEHGDTLIARYQAIDEARNADIGAKYQALQDAAGGEFPIDTQALATNVRTALKKQLATNNAPADVMALLDESAANGKMSLEDFETMRTTLARVQRSASDGQVRHAAGVIRQQVEQLPLVESAQNLKGLADAARSASRERFQALEADPAYKAAVNGTTPPDKFVQKFVIGGTRDNVARLSDAMSGDERAAQTVKVATLDHLRKAAGIDEGYNGNFTQAGFNKALAGLEPKLGYLLDAKTAEMTRTVGDVARYTQFQPKGSFVNNSNTFVAAAAEKAADTLEGVLNYKTGGIPVASFVRGAMKESKLKKAAEKTFAPGAGLTKLSDLAKSKEGQ